MRDEQRSANEQVELEQQQYGAPGGARQNVRAGTNQGAKARPGGATQNSGGALESNDEELGSGPARGAD